MSPGGVTMAMTVLGSRHGVIEELPERQRLVLFLRYYADLDYAEIGRVMRVRPGTVAASLNAGRAAVKKSLDKGEPVWQR